MPSGPSTRSKVLFSALLLSGSAAVAGLGTYGDFTSTTSASGTYSAGSVTVDFGAGTVANRLAVGASGLVPGDSIQRALELRNAGAADLGGASLTTVATTSSFLDSDPDGNMLRLVVDDCSQPWAETALANGGYTYTCGGTLTNVVASRPVIGSNLPLGSVDSLVAGQSDYLRVTLSLPQAADNDLQGASSTIAFSFTGIQRAGTAK